MRDLLSPDEWLIEERGFERDRANVAETLFTIGNGYLGTRGTLEEGHKGERSGTFLNGVFDGHDSPVIDLVNAPDWLSVSVRVDGQRLDMQSCTVVSHRRALDMRQGLLWRSTTFEDRLGRRTRLETLRFASFDDQHLCGLRLEITPENHDAPLTVESAIDGRRFNLDRLPAYAGSPAFDPEVKWEKWAKARHLEEVARIGTGDQLYLEMTTIATGIGIGYAAATLPSVAPRARVVEEGYERIAERLDFAPPAGRRIRIDKLVAICTTRDPDVDPLRERCRAVLGRHRASGFEAALAASRAAWADMWEDCDCSVTGDETATRAIRFNIYHLLIAANGNDPTVNIGAKSLSGEGYRGHVFWDTEIFMLPFFIYTRPETARALLRYRYHTLAGARANAAENGFAGAQYAWESADTGRETTPKWTPDGVHRIWTGEEEIHVSADVAYGVLTYVAATGDTGFLLDAGAEILFETSRFWADRLEYKGAEDAYVLTRVIGPDEFHEHVDNNAFTNRMAQWHLMQAVRIHADLARHHPRELAKVAGRLGLHPDEVERWQVIAEKILIPFDAERGLIEQFEGYFALREVPLTEWDLNGMPCYPEGYHHFNAGGTTLLKQPDVVMLTYVLPDEFSDAVKRANYDFYEARTLHKSSLSPAIHSIMGIEVGDPRRALQYFRRSAFVDLTDNQGNTQDGIHAASAGGTWQALVFGFGGFRVREGRMTFQPWVPQEWQSLRFKLRWRGAILSVCVRHTDIEFVLHGPPGLEETVVVRGMAVTLRSGAAERIDLS
ncbi:glycoside hydrolase family 65 protein [Ensifer soli]|uniref:glycoside hydrolase family 65 protein n=1 Tax=Ciceribacter sp. sgz301302 TaxID=3342379 RepID=UPI0035B87347